MADGQSIQALFSGESQVDHVFAPAGELRPESADLLTGDIAGMHSILEVRLIGVEAGGELIIRGRHAARFAGGSAGVLQGTRTYVLQDLDSNVGLWPSNNGVAAWFNGDFNYDGKVNVDDYVIIDANIGIATPAFFTGSGAGVSSLVARTIGRCG